MEESERIRQRNSSMLTLAQNGDGVASMVRTFEWLKDKYNNYYMKAKD